MSFDGLLLNKLSLELKEIISFRITKIHQLSNTDLLLVLRGNSKNHNLILSISNEYSRVHLSNKEYTTSLVPIGLTMFLRKHFEGNIINNVYTNLSDRVLVISVKGTNEIGDLENKKIIIELMGRNSNIIFTKDDVVIESFKKFGFFDNKRTIIPNAKYEYPPIDKINPLGLSIIDIEKIFIDKQITSPKELTNVFLGTSMVFANMVFSSKTPCLKMFEIINESTNPVVYKKGDKLAFYFNDYSLDVTKNYDTLNTLIDNFYYELAAAERIKKRTNNLLSSVTRIIDRLVGKLDKLKAELDTALNSNLYALYGELLLAYSYLKEYDKNLITVSNYHNNEDITIKLDPGFNLVQNANLYYKKYNKSKTAIIHLENQIDITKNEIKYLQLVHAQIKTANLADVEEIIEELEKERYIKSKLSKKKKKNKINLTTYLTSDNVQIVLGKNNIQNEYLTHKLALPNEMWFHVKDGPGSHVVVRKSEELNEEEIRSAAQIATYFSPNRHSSSVPVVYTKIRFIKKIPKMRNCFVTFSNEKTIYIDPEENFINNLRIKKS